MIAGTPVGQGDHPVRRAAGQGRVVEPLDAWAEPPPGFCSVLLHGRSCRDFRAGTVARSSDEPAVHPDGWRRCTAVAPGPQSQLTAAAISAGSTSRPSRWWGAKSSALRRP